MWVQGSASLPGFVAFTQDLAPRTLQLVAFGFGRRCPRHCLGSLLDRPGSLGLRAVLRRDGSIACFLSPVALRLGLVVGELPFHWQLRALSRPLGY